MAVGEAAAAWWVRNTTIRQPNSKGSPARRVSLIGLERNLRRLCLEELPLHFAERHFDFLQLVRIERADVLASVAPTSMPFASKSATATASFISWPDTFFTLTNACGPMPARIGFQ